MDNQGQGPPLPPTNGTAPDGSAASGADAAPDDAGIKMVLPNISFSMGQPTIGATGAPPGGAPPGGPSPHGGPTPALPPFPPPSNEGYPSGGGYPPDSGPRSTGLGALGIGGDGGDMRGDTRGEHAEHRQKRSAGEMYGGESGDSARGGERGERGERGGGPGGERIGGSGGTGGSGELKRWPGWPGDNVFRFVVPMGKVGSIIGRRGEYVKKICDETKARVKIVEGAPGHDDRVGARGSDGEGGEHCGECVKKNRDETKARVKIAEGAPDHDDRVGVTRPRRALRSLRALLAMTTVGSWRAYLRTNSLVLSPISVILPGLPSNPQVLVSGREDPGGTLTRSSHQPSWRCCVCTVESWRVYQRANHLFLSPLPTSYTHPALLPPQVLVSGREDPDSELPPAVVAMLRVHRRIVEGVSEDEIEASQPGEGFRGQVATRLLVPATQAGSLIGRQGQTIKALQDSTGAHIRILSLGMLAEICFSGRGVSEDEIEASQPGEGFRAQVATRLLVPATQAGSLIGRQGQTIKALQDSTGAHIRILSLEDVPPCALEDDRVVEVTGEYACVHEADVPPCALEDDRVVEVTGEYACVHEAVKGVTLHLRRFLCDHSVLPLFEQCRSFPPPMDPRGAPYASPSSRGGGWGNPPPGGMHSPPHRSRFDLPPSAAPDPYGSLSSLGSMGGADSCWALRFDLPPSAAPDPYGSLSSLGSMGGADRYEVLRGELSALIPFHSTPLGAAAGPGPGGMDANGQLRAALSKYGRETPAAAAAAAMTNTVSPVVAQVGVDYSCPSQSPPVVTQVSVFVRRFKNTLFTRGTLSFLLCYVDAIIGPNGTNIVSATMQIPLSYVDAIIGPNGTNIVSATMQIPLSYVDAIIGPNGTNIVFLRRTSNGVTPSSPSAPFPLHPCSKPLPSHPLQVSATMQIPLSYVDAIIGPNGTNIVFLRRTSGAAVTIQESRGAGGQPEMTVEVRGSATQVQTAQQLIESRGAGGQPEMTVEVRGSATQVQTAQQLIESRGAGGQPEMTVEVHGSATQVQTAQQLIEGGQPEMTVEVRGSATQVQTAQQLIEGRAGGQPETTVEVRGHAGADGTAADRGAWEVFEGTGFSSHLFSVLAAGGAAGAGGAYGSTGGYGYLFPTAASVIPRRWRDSGRHFRQPLLRRFCRMASQGGDPPSQGDDRPSDEAILAQQNAMLEEEAQRYPLVGEKEPLAALASEYAAGSTTFQDKIEHLAMEYEAIRRTRGDGNCFFRCFLFALLEHLLQDGSKEECEQVRERVARSEQRLRDLGYTEFTWEDFAAEYRELLDAVDPSSAAEKITVDGLLKRCQDPDCSNYAVMFLRFITSADIQHRADFFHPFLPDAMASMGAPKEAAKQFCHKAVEPMGEESDHVHITAITDALAVPIRIVYLDRSAGQANFHEFLPEESVQAAPAMTLLNYRKHLTALLMATMHALLFWFLDMNCTTVLPQRYY
ncbi:unnamed protein product [Closterium sp. Yama58-4]|nr:unnamed protein product [Closterium sp. Yama58-4]